MTIKILQVNAQRSLKVAYELRKTVEDNKIDVLILQEPYTFKKQVKEYAPITAKVIQNYENKDSKAAIIIYNKDITVTQLKQFRKEHIICIHLKTNEDSLYIVSVYCQYSHIIDRYSTELEEFIHKLGKNDTG
jgi:hypothetical protein